MPKQKTVPNDIFIKRPLAANRLREALAKVFAIPEQNIRINDESSNKVDWDTAWILAYSYTEGDIEWKLDLFSTINPEEFTAKLEEIAKATNTTLYYDRRGIQYDDRLDVYNLKLILDGAMIREEEDKNKDPVFFIELIK